MAIKLYLEKEELDKRINEIINEHSDSLKKSVKKGISPPCPPIRDIYKLLLDSLTVPIVIKKDLVGFSCISIFGDHDDNISIIKDGKNLIVHTYYPIKNYSSDSVFRRSYNSCIEVLKENDIKFKIDSIA